MSAQVSPRCFSAKSRVFFFLYIRIIKDKSWLCHWNALERLQMAAAEEGEESVQMETVDLAACSKSCCLDLAAAYFLFLRAGCQSGARLINILLFGERWMWPAWETEMCLSFFWMETRAHKLQRNRQPLKNNYYKTQVPVKQLILKGNGEHVVLCCHPILPPLLNFCSVKDKMPLFTFISESTSTTSCGFYQPLELLSASLSSPALPSGFCLFAIWTFAYGQQLDKRRAGCLAEELNMAHWSWWVVDL